VKISCPSCSAKYSIADEKVENRLAKIRCRKCGSTIVIDGKVDPPSVSTTDAAGAATGAQTGGGGAGTVYSVDLADNDQRNMSVAELVAAYNSSQITAETYVWAEGFDDWKPLGEVGEIVEALHAASSPAASAPSAAAGSTSGARGGAASVGGVAAVPRPDLFGGIEKAGSEEDVTTSAPPEEPPQRQLPTGARGESSVLFSLAALTSSTSADHPPAAGTGTTTATKEDSGLIDLKALTAEKESRAAAGGFGAAPAPLGMASPLGMAAPLGGGMDSVVAAVDIPRLKPKNGLYIVGGMAAAAAIVAGAIVATSTKETPAPQPAAIPTPIATFTTKAVEEEEEEEEAEPPATGTAEEKKKPTAAQLRRWAAAAKKKKQQEEESSSSSSSSDTSSGTSSGTSSTGSKPKRKSKCGCAPSDLRCAMRCAAGG
jgi:predicted Zn finger-like uncharacterized protein